jgi:hypothetical protein
MSAPKFASMTSSLLARKGEAFPSDVAVREGKSPFAWNTTDTTHQYRPIAPDVPVRPTAPGIAPVSTSQMHETVSAGFDQDPEPAHNPSFSDHPIMHAGEKRHRLSLPLTAQEHERLGIVAVKRGMTRHQLMRHALDDYFEKLAHEYRSACACVSDGGCRNNCDRP